MPHIPAPHGSTVHGPTVLGATAHGPVCAIIGAGIAGLLAAAALAPHARQVLLLEQDRLPESAALRRRVPQGGHVHALLESGLAAMEALLPGFASAAVAAGSLSLPARAGWRFHSGRGWSQPYEGAPAVLSQSRAQLEHLLRLRVTALANVTLHRARVTGLACGPELCVTEPRVTESHVTGPRVTGLHAEISGAGISGAEIAALQTSGLQTSDSGATLIAADWVIDASGRGGQSAAWLQGCGAPAVPELVWAPDVRYASLMLERDEADATACAWLHLAQAPATRGLVAAPIEGQRWIVTLTERFGTALPATPEAFAEALRHGLEPDLSRRLADCPQIGPVQRFQIDRVRLRPVAGAGLPLGYLPVGDAIATFNPLHAQGMSVAALQALALGDAMARLGPLGPAAMQARYLSEAEALARNAWMIGQAVDLAYPRLRDGAPPEALRRAHVLQAAFATAAHRPAMARRVDRVLHLLDPFAALSQSPSSTPSPALSEYPHEIADHGAALGTV